MATTQTGGVSFARVADDIEAVLDAATRPPKLPRRRTQS
jgi:hypothetical protein